MPILKPVKVDDLFARQAWSACIATLSLEKISVCKPIDEEELDALSKVLALLKEGSRARHLKPEELLAAEQDVTSPLLIASFSAMAGMTSHHSASKATIEVDQTMEDLSYILDQLRLGRNADIDPERLKRAQDACQTLLENSNIHRPSPQQPPYVEF